MNFKEYEHKYSFVLDNNVSTIINNKFMEFNHMYVIYAGTINDGSIWICNLIDKTKFYGL